MVAPKPPRAQMDVHSPAPNPSAVGEDALTMPNDPTIDVGNSNAEVWELIQALVLGRFPASRILELFYWSQEPGLLEMIRGYLALPPDGQAVLRAYFAIAGPRSLSIEIDPAARVILSSPDITDATQLLQEMAKDKAAPKQ